MGKFYIADETIDSQTVDVLKSGAIETASVYEYFYVPSGTATAVISSVPCLLHDVLIAGTAVAADGFLGLFNLADSTELSACKIAGMAAAGSAVALIGTGVRKKYLFDALCNGSLCYMLSGVSDGATPCITITYQLI